MRGTVIAKEHTLIVKLIPTRALPEGLVSNNGFIKLTRFKTYSLHQLL